MLTATTPKGVASLLYLIKYAPEVGEPLKSSPGPPFPTTRPTPVRQGNGGL